MIQVKSPTWAGQCFHEGVERTVLGPVPSALGQSVPGVRLRCTTIAGPDHKGASSNDEKSRRRSSSCKRRNTAEVAGLEAMGQKLVIYSAERKYSIDIEVKYINRLHY
jgi:hypothetical protein